jgi:hypothetical protein
LVARGIGPMLNQQGKVQKMSNANQIHSNQNFEHQQNSNEEIDTGTASPNAFLAIATAYGDYTKKSFEDTKLFVEKLSGVKSLDKAIEVQTEFAKTAYETFVTESQKIGGLYSDLAKQSYKPFGDLVAKMTPTNREIVPRGVSKHNCPAHREVLSDRHLIRLILPAESLCSRLLRGALCPILIRFSKSCPLIQAR